jgi:hypothetical protein
MKLEARGTESIDMYVRRLVLAGRVHEQVVEGEFNGTPMKANPGDSEDDVYSRWHQDRMDYQRNKFAGDVLALSAAMVGRQVFSVTGAFKPTDVDEIYIKLDDGTELVASGLRVSSRVGE